MTDYIVSLLEGTHYEIIEVDLSSENTELTKISSLTNKSCTGHTCYIAFKEADCSLAFSIKGKLKPEIPTKFTVSGLTFKFGHAFDDIYVKNVASAGKYLGLIIFSG